MKTTQISLTKLHDTELLLTTKNLAQRERELTTEIIRHLAEISRRKLYADLKYPSLFEYAVRELGYSEAAASRRIAAKQMVREMPELAQKSTREGERILFAMNGPAAQSRERVRQIDFDYTEFSFTGDAALKAKLQRVRSLMGPRGGLLSLAELVSHMADIATEQLEEKKFGKRRIQAERVSVGDAGAGSIRISAGVGAKASATRSVPSSGAGTAKSHTRYIPQAVKHAVWRAAGGKCTVCSSRHNLQFDHVRPVALGGSSTPDNLQLLCGSCNLRRGVKTFGATAMRRP